MGIPINHPAIAEAIRKGLISSGDLPEKPGCLSELAGTKVRQKKRPAERCERPTGLTTTDPVTEGHAMADEQLTSASAQNQPAQFRPDPTARLDEVPVECVVVRATHFGEPTPKARARYDTRSGRMYTPRNTKVHQQALANAAGEQLLAIKPEAEWAWGIRAVFYVATYQRKDTDNMLKAVLDAMNKRVFADDNQVKETMAWTLLDISNPRTEFIVYRMYPMNRNVGHCTRCGAEFRMFKSWKQRRYCSRKCNVLATTTARIVHCAECNKELLRQPAEIAKNVGGKFYCSGACIGKHNRREVACANCGAAISRPLSLTKESQVAFYCNKSCASAARVGTKMNLAPAELAARANRGWATRRANKVQGDCQ